MKGIFGVVAIGVVVMLAGAPAHAASIVLPRSGQVGVGVQGQFGGLLETGELGQEFGYGPGLTIRVKFRTRYERAMGLSFETRSLDSRSPSFAETAFLASTDSIPRTKLQLSTAGLDLYQFFGTRTRWQAYLSASGGLAQISARLADGETQYPIGGDGFFLGAGAGLERFVYRSWAVDASLRYSAIIMDSTTNHDIEAAIGMTFYAAY